MTGFDKLIGLMKITEQTAGEEDDQQVDSCQGGRLKKKQIAEGTKGGYGNHGQQDHIEQNHAAVFRVTGGKVMTVG